MCLIIHKPKGQTISNELLKNAFHNNGDGWGVMGYWGNEVHVTKGFSLKALKRAVRAYSEASEEVLVHLRWATHGDVNVENCHPFKFGKNSWLMHNGVLTQVDVTENPKMSDTWHFCKQTTELFPTLEEFLKDPEWVYEIEVYTEGSRIAVMTDEGEVIKYNEDDWTLWEGLWLSNTWSCAPKSYYGESYYWVNKDYKDHSKSYTFTDDYEDENGKNPYDMRDIEDDWPMIRTATSQELQLFSQYLLQPDRISLVTETIFRVDNSTYPSETTAMLEAEILDQIENWGGPKFAPYGYFSLVDRLWKLYMNDEKLEEVEAEVVDIDQEMQKQEIVMQNMLEEALDRVEQLALNEKETDDS